MPYIMNLWKLKACWSKTDTPKYTLIAASWNTSTRNMKLPLITTRKNRQWQPPSACVSPTSGKFPMKSGEKCEDVYTVMPSCPCSFVSYMKVISWKIFYIWRQAETSSSLKCSLQTNKHVWVKLHWTDSPKFNNPNQRTQIWSTFSSLQKSVGQSHAPF